MRLKIHSSFLPHRDPDASVAFYRDALGFEVRLDVGTADMRRITVGPPDQPDTAIVLHSPLANPALTEDEKHTLLVLMAKGSYFAVNLATPDLDECFARLVQLGAEIVREPVEQSDGVRECAVRDPAGNLIRIEEAR